MRFLKIIIFIISIFIFKISYAQTWSYEKINNEREGLTFKDEYKIDDISHKIIIKHKKFMNMNYYYSFDLFIDNKKMEWSSDDNNKLIGCGNEFGNELQLKRLLAKEGNIIGWIVDGLGSICGNTYSKRTYLIILNENKSIQKFKIDSKSGVIFNTINLTDTEIWYYTQHWGNSATAGSFFIPRKKILRFEPNYKKKYYLSQGNILTNISKLNDFKIDYLYPNYVGLFYAGILDLSPNLINYAFKNYYVKDSKEYYEIQNTPLTSDKIKEVCKYIIKNGKAPVIYLNIE